MGDAKEFRFRTALGRGNPHPEAGGRSIGCDRMMRLMSQSHGRRRPHSSQGAPASWEGTTSRFVPQALHQLPQSGMGDGSHFFMGPSLKLCSIGPSLSYPKGQDRRSGRLASHCQTATPLLGAVTLLDCECSCGSAHRPWQLEAHWRGNRPSSGEPLAAASIPVRTGWLCWARAGTRLR